MKKAILLVLALLFNFISGTTLVFATGESDPHAVPTWDVAQARSNALSIWSVMASGNAVFQRGEARPDAGVSLRQSLAAGQQPMALVVTCSDSRVPPELLFNQGLGKLFVVRCAGNIVDYGGRGSLEYAYSHFKTPLIVILGHSNCGALKATQDFANALPLGIRPTFNNLQEMAGSQSLFYLMNELLPHFIAGWQPYGSRCDSPDCMSPISFRADAQPVISQDIKRNTTPEGLAEAIRANVVIQGERITTSPILADAVRQSQLFVMTAVYDLPTGRLTQSGWVSPSPRDTPVPTPTP